MGWTRRRQRVDEWSTRRTAKALSSLGHGSAGCTTDICGKRSLESSFGSDAFPVGGLCSAPDLEGPRLRRGQLRTMSIQVEDVSAGTNVPKCCSTKADCAGSRLLLCNETAFGDLQRWILRARLPAIDGRDRPRRRKPSPRSEVKSQGKSLCPRRGRRAVWNSLLNDVPAWLPAYASTRRLRGLEASCSPSPVRRHPIRHSMPIGCTVFGTRSKGVRYDTEEAREGAPNRHHSSISLIIPCYDRWFEVRFLRKELAVVLFRATICP